MSSKWEQEIKDLHAQSGGKLHPDDVVEFARDAGTALHGRFTWDDSEAAKKWRVEEARGLIQVVVQKMPSAQSEQRAFISLSTDRDEGGYRSTAEVMSSREMRRIAFHDAVRELVSWKARHELLTKELGDVFVEIDKLDKKVQRQQKTPKKKSQSSKSRSRRQSVRQS